MRLVIKTVSIRIYFLAAVIRDYSSGEDDQPCGCGFPIS